MSSSSPTWTDRRETSPSTYTQHSSPSVPVRVGRGVLKFPWRISLQVAPRIVVGVGNLSTPSKHGPSEEPEPKADNNPLLDRTLSPDPSSTHTVSWPRPLVNWNSGQGPCTRPTTITIPSVCKRSCGPKFTRRTTVWYLVPLLNPEVDV